MNGIEWFKGRRCTVTGSRGYIGSRLERMLDDDGALTGKHQEPDVVFHLAAQTSALIADENQFVDWAQNVAPLYRLIEEWRTATQKPFVVFAGSATQAGAGCGIIDGTEQDKPMTVYDLHKLAAEQALEHACRRGWARGTTLRLANVYGPSQAESGPDRGVVNRWIRCALKGQPIDVHGSGEWMRDYVYVDDVCRAFMLAAANQERTNGRHFVVGSGEGHEMVYVASEIRRAAMRRGKGATVRHVDAELDALAKRRAVISWHFISRATGWEPTVQLPDGIERTMAHYAGES